MPISNPIENLGSMTPQLEGAPRSQSHELRQGAAQVAMMPNVAETADMTGGDLDAAQDTNV